jgi:hypothetical protein
MVPLMAKPPTRMLAAELMVRERWRYSARPPT